MKTIKRKNKRLRFREIYLRSKGIFNQDSSKSPIPFINSGRFSTREVKPMAIVKEEESG